VVNLNIVLSVGQLSVVLVRFLPRNGYVSEPRGAVSATLGLSFSVSTASKLHHEFQPFQWRLVTIPS
ncbi:MAG TPA: hypothetical protein VIV66_13650, partial [Pyrinomonadaceae bacterium]